MYVPHILRVVVPVSPLWTLLNLAGKAAKISLERRTVLLILLNILYRPFISFAASDLFNFRSWIPNSVVATYAKSLKSLVNSTIGCILLLVLEFDVSQIQSLPDLVRLSRHCFMTERSSSLIDMQGMVISKIFDLIKIVWQPLVRALVEHLQERPKG